jgi:3-phosphoshikimate 1-carboxyvinyltransferase
LSHKETDRLKAVAEALRQLGCAATYADGSFNAGGRITDPSPPPFDPRGDHRMAMALAPLALVCGAITLSDPDVVNKSYPTFWKDLVTAGFRVEYHG